MLKDLQVWAIHGDSLSRPHDYAAITLPKTAAHTPL
jgi:hypothetical protein